MKAALGLCRDFLKRTAMGVSAGLLIALPLQGMLTSAVSATVAGTWTDGDTPQLVVGAKIQGPPLPSCYPTTFNYYSYTLPNGQYDSLGRLVPIDVCARSVGFGEVGSAVYQYIKPGTSLAFKVFDSTGRSARITPYSNGAGFYWERPTPFFGPSTYLALFDSVGAAGKFIPSNNELAYVLNPIDSNTFLKDSAGNLIVKMPPTAISSNNQWMAIYAQGLGLVRINIATRAMILFDTQQYNYDLGFAPSIILAISDDGSTVIKSGNGDSATDTVLYDLSGCQGAMFVNGAANSTAGCRSRRVQNDLVAAHPGYVGIANMTFSSDGKSIRGTADIHNALGAHEYYSATYSVAGYQPPHVSYLALGDSFSSGEGAFSYEQGTDTSENKCHLSTKSYPYLVAETLRIGGADFHSVACSGATSWDYSPDIQHNNIDDFVWLPGESPQQLFVDHAQPDVVTISMIGNDIGFSNKIQRCIGLIDSCFHFKEDRESIAQEIRDKFDTLVNLYEDIQKQSGGAKVYVLGYPQLMSTDTHCDANTPFDPEEREMARGLVTYLDAVIKAATQKSGVQYVDVENAFAGHELCDPGMKAVNGLTAGNDLGIFGVKPIGAESFHPNQFGHELMSQALLAQSQNLTKPMPVFENDATVDPHVIPPYVGSSSYDSFVNSAPVSGGRLKRAIYTSLGVADLIVEGSSFIVHPTDQYLKANGVFDVWINSTPTYVGSLSSDANGNLSGDLTLPRGLSPGFHTVHIYGQNIAGEDIDLYKTVYVAASATDYDGDGIPNSEEKCLAVDPVNVDVDHDGVDDACDPEIPLDTTPPTVTGTPDRAANANGWHNGDVTINWTATDPDPSSGAPTQPAATLASQEGVHTYTSNQSCDPLNNCAAGSLELKIDKTAPDISYSLSPAPTAGGWNNSDITVTFTCSDATSGVASCPDPQIVTGADGMYVVTGTATDNAGNTGAVNVFISLDSTKPMVTQSALPAANASGWNNTDVTVTPTCADNLSGILECSPAATISTEGAGQAVVSAATDKAGNTATASTSLNIDKTAPMLGDPTWTNNPKSTLGIATIEIPTADNLSGIDEAEYYLGDTDPGQGNGATMQVNSGTISVNFGTDFPTGVYKVTMRAKDKAGNWSLPTSDYLVVYDPFGVQMTGHKKLLPSLAGGDALPGLISNSQTDKAKFGFNVRYDSSGNIHPESDFQFKYETGTNCRKPTLATNCHEFELNSTSIAWLTTQGTNDSMGIFQGTAKLEVDEAKSNVIFRITGLDGERLDSTTQDHLLLSVYPDGANPNTATPIYQVNNDVLRGNIKIRKW